MSISDGDIIQAIVDFVPSTGDHFLNKFVWLAQLATAVDEGNFITFANAVLSALYNELAAELNSEIEDPDVTYDKLEWVTDDWEVSDNIGESALSTTFTNTSEFLPFQTAAVMSGRTPRPRSRGRKFLPPFGEDQAVGGVLISGAISDLSDALADYIDDMDMGSGNSFIPGVASTVTQGFLPFVGGIASDILGTQRRRRKGIGY
jgi:hypothetical protein